MQYSAKDLLQSQAELVDAKVEMAVSKAIDKVVDQINSLKKELKTDIHEMRGEMNSRFSEMDRHMNTRFSEVDKRLSGLDNRLVTVETRLGIAARKEEAIFSRLLDYAFKAMWVILGTVVLFVLLHH